MSRGSAGDAALVAVLDRARTLGYLGPGPLGTHVAHAAGFLDALAAHGLPDRAVVADLGAGGGVPGLVLASRRADLRLLLIEARQRRAAFLEAAAVELGFERRTEVVATRAELVGRSAHRSQLDAVVARGFGLPAVTAECAAPLLRSGGLLVVSEPPEPAARWPAPALAELGLVLAGRVSGAFHYQVLRQGQRCPERYPRRPGIPRKRPLF